MEIWSLRMETETKCEPIRTVDLGDKVCGQFNKKQCKKMIKIKIETKKICYDNVDYREQLTTMVET